MELESLEIKIQAQAQQASGQIDALVTRLGRLSSALCTVGLTTGITPTLCTASKLILIVFMFFGRVGIMTIGVGFMMGDRAKERVQYAQTKVMIG